MVDDSQCPICQSPIKSSTDGSLTQWILSCHCYDAHVDKSQTLSARICTTCAKPMKQGLPGSFTQFIFQSEFCSCNAPPGLRVGMAAAALAPQPEYKERNEEELPVEQNTFPVERYRPLKMLGAGKFGSVYLARDRLLDKKVAVKTLNALSDNQLVSFQQEAKTLSKLKHQSIVRVLDFGTVNTEVPYMVLDYVNGETMRKVIDRDGPMPWETAIDVFGQICGAFEYAHKNGILHRDLNPQNVLLVDRSHKREAIGNDSQFEVRIIDFGIADLVNARNESVKAGKTEQSLVGTPLYMSPDPGNGRPYEVRSEIYSVGCMLFEALSGRPPFMGNTAIETLTLHALEPPPDLSETTELYIPPAVQRIVEKALAKTPESRFPTMGALKEALEKAVSEAGSVGESDVQEASGVSRSFVEGTNARGWTASYPVSLLIAVTVIAIAGFCYLAYSFATQEQPLTKRLAGNLAPQDSARTPDASKKKATSSESDHHKSEIEQKILDDSFEKKWSRNPKNPSQVTGYGVSDDDLDFKELDAGPPIGRLDIQSDSLTTRGIEQIAALPALDHLLLRFSTLPSHFFSTIAKSKTMYILDVAHSKPIDPQDLMGLASCPKLVILKLSSTHIDDNYARALEKTRLTTLHVNNNEFTDAALPSFAKIKTLKALTIRPAPGITLEGLKRFAKLKPDCTILTDND